MSEIVILGAGMAGYGASYKFNKAGIETKTFEKNNYIGGHCASFIFDNKWIFDDGPHISFSKIDHIKALFAENINHDYYEFGAEVDNYWKGRWVKHPAQTNLFDFPAEFKTQILLEMIEAKNNKSPEINNYRDWLYASYGKTFSENFPMKYTRKFHTTDAVNLSTEEWIGPRLYQPKLSEVIHGMLTLKTPDLHYIKNFRYPNNGGFVSLMSGIHKTTDICLNQELTSINLKGKKLTFNNNTVVDYNYCFSSLPVNSIVNLMEDAPEEVKIAASKLAATQCVLVNFGVNRSDLSPSHWRYVYDEDFYSTRLSFPHMFNPVNAPRGCGSIQIEIYFSDKYKPLNRKPDDFIPIIYDELIQMGVLSVNDEILFQNAWLSPFAQVIFDHERKDNLSLIHEFLLENDIYFGGRFADWAYIWSDESFLKGEQAAEKILQKI